LQSKELDQTPNVPPLPGLEAMQATYWREIVELREIC